MPEAHPVFHGTATDTGRSTFDDPVEGFELEREQLSITPRFQREKLGAAGVDPAVFADIVDPTLFIGVGIEAGIRSGISAEGNINMMQRLVQNRPVELGETLTVRGRIERIREVPRGQTVETTVHFVDESGVVVIDASRRSLRPSPHAAQRGAGDRPPPVVPDPTQAQVIAEHTLSPDRVTHYLSDANSIHYDEEAAKKAGFRAPMIAGGMGVHYLVALLWSGQPPRSLDLDIYFRRPIFWDEHFVSAVLGQAESRSGWSGLCLLRDEGPAGLKVLTEARVRSFDSG